MQELVIVAEQEERYHVGDHEDQCCNVEGKCQLLAVLYTAGCLFVLLCQVFRNAVQDNTCHTDHDQDRQLETLKKYEYTPYFGVAQRLRLLSARGGAAAPVPGVLRDPVRRGTAQGAARTKKVDNYG